MPVTHAASILAAALVAWTLVVFATVALTGLPVLLATGVAYASVMGLAGGAYVAAASVARVRA